MNQEQNSWQSLSTNPVPGLLVHPLTVNACANTVTESESEVAQSCPTLCNSVDCSLPRSFLHVILQARILEWVAISFSRGSSWPRDRTQVSHIAGRHFNLWATREAPVLSPPLRFSSVSQCCLTLCDPMECSTPGLPVHHQLQEFIQTHAHWVKDAIQPSHPLLSHSPPAFSLSQHQGLFKWVSSSHQVAKVLEFQLQHQFFQWTPRTDFL